MYVRVFMRVACACVNVYIFCVQVLCACVGVGMFMIVCGMCTELNTVCSYNGMNENCVCMCG